MTVIPASPDWYIRESYQPIIGWLIEGRGPPSPITVEGVLSGFNLAITGPDGRVHFTDKQGHTETWLTEDSFLGKGAGD